MPILSLRILIQVRPNSRDSSSWLRLNLCRKIRPPLTRRAEKRRSLSVEASISANSTSSRFNRPRLWLDPNSRNATKSSKSTPCLLLRRHPNSWTFLAVPISMVSQTTLLSCSQGNESKQTVRLNWSLWKWGGRQMKTLKSKMMRIPLTMEILGLRNPKQMERETKRRVIARWPRNGSSSLTMWAHWCPKSTISEVISRSQTTWMWSWPLRKGK